MENKAAEFPSRDLFLNTQGICFLCVNSLTRQDEKVSTTTNHGNGRGVHLRLLCRYLNVSPIRVLQSAIGLSEEEAKEDDSKNQCNFSVSLCGQCASLVEEMTALVKQQEMVAMLLEHHVKVLKHVLVNSKEIRITDVINGLGRVMEPVEEKLVEQLRIETRRKCIQKESTLDKETFPKLIIPHAKPSLPPIVPDITKSECYPDRLNSPSKLSGPHSQNVSISNIISDPAQATTIPISVKFFRKLKNGRFACSICNLIAKHGNNTQRHLVNLHPEIFFSSSKLPTLTEEAFKRCCMHMLATNVQMLGGRDAVCTICNKTYSTVPNLKAHLVSQHRADLFKCLFQIQKKEEKFQSVSSAKQKKVDDKRACSPTASKCNNSKSFRCDFDSGGCGVVFKYSHALKRHQLRAKQGQKDLFPCQHWDNGVECAMKSSSKCALSRHQKQTDHKNIPAGVQKEWLCLPKHGGCGRVLSSRKNWIRHRKENCPKLLRRTITKTPTIIRGTKEPLPVCCVFESGGCGKAFSQWKHLLTHKRRAKRLTSKKWLCPYIGDEYMCFQEFDSICALNRHKKEFSHAITINEKSPLVCKAGAGGCGRMFSKMDKLVEHVKRSCLKNSNSLATLENNDTKPVILGTVDLMSHKDNQRNLVASNASNDNGQPRRWVCMLRKGGCERTFASKYGLTRHQRLRCMKRRGENKLTPRQQIIKRE